MHVCHSPPATDTHHPLPATACAEGTINNSPEQGRSPTLGDCGTFIVFRVLKAHPIEFAQYLRSIGCAFSTCIFVILENPNESSFGLRIGLIWVVPLAQEGRSKRDQTTQHRVEPRATPCEPHPTITESCKDSTTATSQLNRKNPRLKTRINYYHIKDHTPLPLFVCLIICTLRGSLTHFILIILV